MIEVSISQLERLGSSFAKFIVWLVISFVSIFSVVLLAEEKKAVELNLLVYNTHGLPTIFARDKPRWRFPKIIELAHAYDVSLFQEDFAHHDLIQTHAHEALLISRGENAGVAKCPVCSGSGLTFLSSLTEFGWQVSTSFEPFETCSGWLNKANDCFAQKGFQIIDLISTEGDRLVLVNTHMDAGRSEFDRVARAAQLDQLIRSIENRITVEALIVAGDLNLDWDNTQDRELLFDFRDRLGLAGAVNGKQSQRGWTVLDYIFYKSGTQTNLKVLESGEDVNFVSGALSLSDHPALFARFSIY